MLDDFNPFGPIDLKRWPRALFRLDSLGLRGPLGLRCQSPLAQSPLALAR